MTLKYNNEQIYEHLKKNNDCCYINEIYLMITSNVHKIDCGYIRIYIVFTLSVILSGILLIVNLLFEQTYNYNNKIAIARVASEKRKIQNVYEGIQLIEDDIKNCDFTMYRIGSRGDRLAFLIKYFLKFCIKDINQIKEILKNEHLAPFTSTVLLMCAKRIPHTVIYKYAIEHIMLNYNLSTVYIGATYERFALIAESLSKKYKKKLICIPHGVESTEKKPAGYVGDIFYCSSPEMASKLNALYETSKFIFDDAIICKMYHVKKTGSETRFNKTKKVVFFTQPLEMETGKKIMSSISKHLETKKQKLYIKVHPLENSSDYAIKNTEVINDFEEAIIGNLCISLISTILLEGLYNDSTSISIIHLVDDTIELTGRYEFLNDQRILKPENETALLETIDKFIK